MSKVLPFPNEEVRVALRALQSMTVDPDEEVAAALVLAGTITGGGPKVYVTKALSVLKRHRNHYRALELAEKLSETGHREVRRLGLAMVDREVLEDVEVGFTLLGA